MIRPLQGSASKVVYDRAQSDAKVDFKEATASLSFLRRECNRLDAENAALRRALETARCEATAAHATAQLCARVACDGDGLGRSLGPSSTRLEITAFGDAVVESEAALQLAERRRKRLVKQRNDDRATAAAAFAAAGKLADARQAKLLRDGAAAAAAAAAAFAAVSAEVRRLRPGARVADDAQRLAGARAQCEALRLKAKAADEALLLSNNAMDAVETQLADLRAAADEDRAGRAKAAHASREEVAHGRAQPAKRDAEDRASRARDDAARGGSARSSGDEVFFARGDSARSSRDGAARGDSARNSRDGAPRGDSARGRDRAPSSVDDRSVVCLEDDASAAPKRAPPAAAPTMAPAAAPTMAPAAPPTPAPATACDEAAIVEAHNAPLSVGDARRLKWFGAVEFQVNAVGVSLTAKAGRLRVVEARGLAATAGIEQGDVICCVAEQRDLADPRRVAQLLSAARKRGDATITFVFERDDPGAALTAQLAAAKLELAEAAMDAAQSRRRPAPSDPHLPQPQAAPPQPTAAAPPTQPLLVGWGERKGAS